MSRKINLILLILLITMAVAGCATSISTIKAEPAVYVGKNVTVAGEVSLEIPIPFMDFSLFQIDDGSGRMFLISGGTYHIGDSILTSARVIGITEKDSKKAAAEITRETANFMVENGIAEPVTAANLSKKLIRLIAALGEQLEGSYFLITK